MCSNEIPPKTDLQTDRLQASKNLHLVVQKTNLKKNPPAMTILD
jgi:hypothetical protein